MFETKNDLSEQFCVKAVELLHAQLPEFRPATPGKSTPPP
jgi:hypothetical protein